MTKAALVWSGVRHRLGLHLGTMCGAAISSAILIGALVVGDSVRGSLRHQAAVRLGHILHAAETQDRLFTAPLASALQADLGGLCAAVLRLPGTAARGDGEARANGVQILGVDDNFWALGIAGTPQLEATGTDRVLINSRLAAQLRVLPDDEILIRFPKPSALSRDAPLAPEENASAAMRLKVAGIVPDTELGDFSLQASQIPPFNVFVALGALQARAGVSNHANVLLVGARRSTAPLHASNLEGAVRKVWALADAQLELRNLPANGQAEIRSSRVFLDPPVAAAAVRASSAPVRILTYFVNEIRAGERATPYSMVTAADPPLVPSDLKPDEILVNQWLAEDLGLQTGAQLTLRYYIVGLGRALEERSAAFTVRSILPMNGPTLDPSLMPDFPGLTDADNCRDWDTGFPIDNAKIRDTDEKYWDDHRGTPKAFVSLAAGQKLWRNRFGDLTAVRHAAAGTNESAGISRATLAALDPAVVGLRFNPVKEMADAGVNQSQDFGGLFIGFSFFLITSALILMGLLFQFSLEQRAPEIGALLAVGFTPRQVRGLLLGEGCVVSGLGGLLGVAGGLWYARVMIAGLTTAWRDAVGTTALRPYVEIGTVMGGWIAGMLVAALTLYLGLRRHARQPVRALLAGEAGGSIDVLGPRRRISAGLVSLVSVAGGLLLVGAAFAGSGEPNPGLFFGAGALLLIAGLAWGLWQLARLRSGGPGGAGADLTTRGLALRNCARRPRRSLATSGLIASGTFLVASIGVFRLDAVRGAEKRSSGTGGFALIGASSLPVVHDLNKQAGRDFFGLDSKSMMGVTVVPLRVREGEEASCLNLNRAQRPRLVGVDSRALDERAAFTFVRTHGSQPANPWSLLRQPQPDGAIPAVGDLASILWALGRKVGDTLVFTDERGGKFKVRLVGAVANSVLQGNLLIDESHFVSRFPGESGYRMFLVDAPSDQMATVSAVMSRALRDVGLELTPAGRRLAEFNAVQNTYLGTFQILGGLGLVLGSVGLGVMVSRNVLERRSELALMLAVGFVPGRVRRIVSSEHLALLVVGLGVGLGSAAVAVLPAVAAAGTEVPYRSLGLIIVGIAFSGLVWTELATRVSLRGRILDGLRSE